MIFYGEFYYSLQLCLESIKKCLNIAKTRTYNCFMILIDEIDFTFTRQK